MGKLFNLLFTKKDFNKEKFFLAQKICYPKFYLKAQNKKSFNFIIDNNLLLFKNANTTKIVLPYQIVLATFINLHARGVHTIDSLMKEKITKNFYIPIKELNKCVKRSLETCVVCSVIYPAPQRRYVGLGRSLTEHLSSGKNLYADIAYIKIKEKTYFIFLLVDMASSYLIAKVFDTISVLNVKDYMLTLYSIIGLNNCLISDSGAENSKILTETLQQLGIKHKRISPLASDQNTTESNIRIFRHVIKKLIASCQQDNLAINFSVVEKLGLIATNIINTTAPYNGFFSRKELFFGLYYSKRSDKMSKYINKKDMLHDAKGIILYQDLEKFYDKRLQILHKKNLKMNKKSTPIFLQRGDFVTDKKEKKKTMGYEDKKIYYVVVRIISPRCHICLNSIDRCLKCDQLPVYNVKLVNLVTGNQCQRSVTYLSNIKLSQTLDPNFYLKMSENASKNVHFSPHDLNLNHKNEELPSNYYNLRSLSKGGHLEGNFSLVKENNKYYLKKKLCTIVSELQKPLLSAPKKSILKKDQDQVYQNSNLWTSWANHLSSDQLVGIIKALKTYLELNNKDIYTLYNIQKNEFMELTLRHFFNQYKNGAVSLALSNQIKFKELYDVNEKKKSYKKVTFCKELSICLINNSDNCEHPMSNYLSKNEKVLLNCVSGIEAKLLKPAVRYKV